jgi:hypothetical protein
MLRTVPVPFSATSQDDCEIDYNGEMKTIIRLVSLGALLLAAFRPSATAAEPPTKAPVLMSLKPGEEAVLFAGKNLDGWKTLDEFSFEKHGAVTVEKGEIRLTKGKPATGIAWKGDLPRSDFELSFDAKRVEGDDFFCGLTFPVGKEYCTLILGGWGGKATGLSNVDGMAAIENETTGYEDFKDDTWYRVRLRVTAEKIEAWLGKSQIVELKRAERKFSIWWEQEPARPLGIATWHTSAAVRDVRFKRLAP